MKTDCLVLVEFSTSTNDKNFSKIKKLVLENHVRVRKLVEGGHKNSMCIRTL